MIPRTIVGAKNLICSALVSFNRRTRLKFFWSILLFVGSASFAAEPPSLDYSRYVEGKFVFERNCLICHGRRGDGTGEMAGAIYPKPHSFREGMFKFRTTPFGALPTDDDLRHTIRYGLNGTAMGMFTRLSDEEISGVIEYVKSFSRRWRKTENYAEPMNLPAPPAWLNEAGHVEKGRALFAAHCTVCHGPEADGKGVAAPALKDIWNAPVKPSDLRQSHLRCGDRPEDIYRVLATGLNGTPMVSFDAALTPEQRWDIVAWIFTRKLATGPILGGAPPREAKTRITN